MPRQTVFEQAVAELIVSALDLEDIRPADIDPVAPLFGTGLGLDSIDALELALAITKKYGVQLRSDSEHDREAFRTLRELAAYIAAQREVIA